MSRGGDLRPSDPVPGAVQVEPPVPATVDPGSERIYYPQLDGLRFVAFALVYLFHGGLPEFAGWVDAIVRAIATILPGEPDWARRGWGFRIRSNGWVGVQLFFILSGYLITTLLLREERRFGQIDLRAFWVRRILRIWPLYYWVVFLGFFVLAWWQGQFRVEGYGEQVARHLPAFLVFLGNWSMGLLGPVWTDALTVLWSVCVEEQFYLLCPLLIAFVPARARVAVVAVLMAGAVVGRFLMARAAVGDLLFQWNTITQLDTLLSGVLMALILERPGVAEAARRFAGWLTIPLGLGWLWLLTRPELAKENVTSKTFDFVWLWLLGAGVVVSLVVRRGWVHRLLAHRWLVWLGRISYGLYMYHEITLWLGRSLIGAIGWFPNKEILTTLGCFGLTVGVAAASYYWLERPFLRWKRSWTRVPSRPV